MTAYPSDLEIANAADKKPIDEIAKVLGIDQNGMHKIRIHDNGGNIAADQKNRIFEQFYRIPKGDVHDVKGFGIGLYYVRKILEKHEGKIELLTGKNSTTFITYWP